MFTHNKRTLLSLQCVTVISFLFAIEIHFRYLYYLVYKTAGCIAQRSTSSEPEHLGERLEPCSKLLNVFFFVYTHIFNSTETSMANQIACLLYTNETLL